ncbi:MAG: cobalamin biosynthesis protein CbiM [Anaerolineales bacterium]|nr:MAG: cobalamin biosynthesis protein CbiM [Anaerolineales bacterium]
MFFSPTPLHIPDGFLSIGVSLVGWFLAVIFIGIALRQTRDQLGERQVPLMGILAAFIFAAQAINFPVAAGTSGHLLGGTLAAIVLGPWAGTLVMTAVIAVQALLFQDGGLLVMGWNILNMGVITTFTGYAVYMLVVRFLGTTTRSRLIGGFTGAWLSVVVSAIAAAIELAVSGTSPLHLGLPAMAGVHALIGLGEAVITVGAIGLLQASRPQVLTTGETAPGRRTATFTLAGLLVALGVAAFSPLASAHPDGLEFIAELQGFLGLAQNPSYELMPDYTLPFLSDPVLTTILAVAVGTLVVFGLAWFIARSSVQRSTVGD